MRINPIGISGNISTTVCIGICIGFNLVHTLSPRHIPRTNTQHHGHNHRRVEEEGFGLMCKCSARVCDRCVRPRARKAARLFRVVVAGFHHLRKCLFHIVTFFLIINHLILRALRPFASRTRICIYVRRKSWQRYNFFAYIVDILLISFYLREGQGVTEKKNVFRCNQCVSRGCVYS